MEVSSPGLERKFKSEREYIVFRGKNVSVKLKEPLEGEEEKIFKATLTDYNPAEGAKFVRLSDKKEITLTLDKIQSTKLYLE